MPQPEDAGRRAIVSGVCIDAGAVCIGNGVPLFCA
jgi:hypothetical protein